MKSIAILLGFCLVVAFLPTFMPQPTYAMTGSGAEGDPYIIYNVTDLQDIESDLGAYYELANDIDASGIVFTPISNFAGHFDGQNYTIWNLTVVRYGLGFQNGGLFIVNGGIVENLGLRDISIDVVGTGYARAGGLCQSNTGTVTNVWVTGSVYTEGNHSAADSVAGGFCQTNSGTITYCWFLGDVYANSVLGTDWSGDGSAAGFAEENFGTISKCYASAHTLAWGHLAWGGGFCNRAQAWSSISNCYARGDVDVTGIHIYAGGFVDFAYAYSAVTKCYSTGNPAGLSGGFIYDSQTTGLSACFWDTQTSGTEVSDGGTGQSTALMKVETPFTDAGWDFDTIWGIDPMTNNGYPFLLGISFPFPWADYDIYQVVWFQPNYIIQGDELPNRAGYIDGEFHWGANPAGITISHGELVPEEEYDFEPIIPSGQDIIEPEPETMIGDVDTEALHDNPLYPLVQVLTIPGFLTDRLVWLGLAWLIVIGCMFAVHLGFDTHKGSEKPQHFILTTITGLGLSILFYTMGIFPFWVVILMAFGLVGAIIWERQPVL